ncbi:exported protein of unknown function [Beijerinckiaceae bacterium RH AL1]|nr:hypothetical protein [Beijerinckiaceae bacterium]VVB49835.1 exported protein of unknown function [Beijerinckiaceae bacterium RH CH11]VVB49912.1 exported protein of unknown function [Beijerinckiaceae bacterium RH AL8]VVC57100.1 exported protein of unknown function [Beijerinckiaceae bacterium RH AL1]
MSSFMSRLVVLLAVTPLLTSAGAFADPRRPAPPQRKAPAAAAPDCELSGGSYALDYARDDRTGPVRRRLLRTAESRPAPEACPAEDVGYDLLAAAEPAPSR